MAAPPSNHWKLGLFVVCTVMIGVGTVVILGARSLHKDTVAYQSYMDESVQGLEIGSPVKFRGVTIGTVSAIGVAPDRRHVMLTSDLATHDVAVMGLASGEGKATQLRVPPDLRIQLASAGITGVKFLQLDFFPVKDNPPPVLPFPVGENYIPAATSTMKNLEDAVVHAVDRFPEMADAALAVMAKLDGLLDQVDERHLPEHVSGTLALADQTLTGIKKTFADVQADKVSGQAQQTLAKLDDTVVRVNAILARIDADKGLLGSAERASNAVGDVATNVRDFTDEMGTTLHDVQQASESLQKLTDALELDSDMLLKGRAKVR
jgi:phospholipid/cholesterol/gamma-HCH transport system substrate-binding protein